MNNHLDLYRGPEFGDQAIARLNSAAHAERDVIDMRSWVTMLRRRLGLFFAVLAAVLVIAVLLTVTETPIYSASAQVAMNARDNPLTPEQNQGSQLATPSTTLVDTQVEEITSRTMAERVADALRLADDAAFNPSLKPSIGKLDRLKMMFGAAAPPVAPSTAEERRAAAIDELTSYVSAARIDETYALSIRYEADDPEVAARVANEYARQFTAGGLAAKGKLNEAQVQVLRARLNELQMQANADTALLQQFRNANGIPSTTGATLTEQEISAYNQQVAGARAQLAEDQARLATARAQLRTGSTGGDVGEALGSGVVSGLRGRQAELGGTVANLAARYGPRHPDLIKAKSELAEIDRQIQAEIGRILSNLEAKVRVSEGRLAAISGSLSGARAALARNNAAMVGLDDLQRRADSSNAVYKSYLDSYRQAVAREGSEQADSRILSPAQPSYGPISPNIILNLMLAAAIGTGLGLAAAFAAEQAYSGVTTGHDVEDRLGVRYLGSVPTLATVLPGARSPIASVLDHPRSAFAEAFRSLRTAIEFTGRKRVQVIAVTSALPSEGKTTVAACLARIAAVDQERVVLVDCDLRQRGISQFLRAEADRPGLMEVLEGSATLDDALVRDEQSGSYFLPVVAAAVERVDLLAGEAMDRLIDALRARFSYVILDAAPLLPIAAARVLVGKADAAVFVARWRHTPDHAVRAALRLIPGSHVALAGIVLSRVDMNRQARFGYGDESYYYRKFKSYYS